MRKREAMLLPKKKRKIKRKGNCPDKKKKKKKDKKERKEKCNLLPCG